ncbi:hypothetical protein NBO_2g0063 [Nosema bombycis CQ1]|uniref:Uncharacterized protein n=1 Tax=Nosema bombycis (strain CQ1 / CVCC 102059) TaxID=578461 RepID=R0KZE0_NOSB1|nr:hypothetical protein NBO_2g0063 [Nosema bombycis CQ1]|eukprot:EOB15572.1 hypothetical protein NBO_2g0063 [Nosema bombycis CQ1]
MNLNTIFLIISLIKAIRQSGDRKKRRFWLSRGDVPYEYTFEPDMPHRGDQLDSSDDDGNTMFNGHYYTDDNEYGHQTYDQRNAGLSVNYLGRHDNNYTSYPSYFNPLMFVNPRGDTAYDSSIRDIINNPRGDFNIYENEAYIMQGDDPNVYDDQIGVSKDSDPNVSVVTQPKEEDTQNNVSEKSDGKKNVDQPLVENDLNENIREHQLTPQVFTRISGGKPQADDEKSEHSIAGSYIPVEKLRMGRRLTFTCSRSISVININFV